MAVQNGIFQTSAQQKKVENMKNTISDKGNEKLNPPKNNRITQTNRPNPPKHKNVFLREWYSSRGIIDQFLCFVCVPVGLNIYELNLYFHSFGYTAIYAISILFPREDLSLAIILYQMPDKLKGKTERNEVNRENHVE